MKLQLEFQGFFEDGLTLTTKREAVLDFYSHFLVCTKELGIDIDEEDIDFVISSKVVLKIDNFGKKILSVVPRVIIGSPDQDIYRLFQGKVLKCLKTGNYSRVTFQVSHLSVLSSL